MRGLRLRADGNFRGALEQFREAFEATDPTSSASSKRARRAMLLGETLSILGRFGEADERYTDALHGPVSEDIDLLRVRLNTWRLRSALRLTQGRISEARAAVDEAVRLSHAVSAEDLEYLDLQLQIAFVAEAEGQFGLRAPTELIDLTQRYGLHSDAAGARGQAYCRMLMARIAIAAHEYDRAIQLTDEVVQAAFGERVLRRVLAQALHASGEAHLGAAQFARALTAFDDCAQRCLRDDKPLPELRRVFIDATLGKAAALRAIGQVEEGHRQLLDVAKTIDDVEDAAPLQSKYLLALGMSHIQRALDAPEVKRRAQLSLARSALRRADLVRQRTDGTARLGIQICTTLAYVQRALGRPRQARVTLQQGRPLIESPVIFPSDRGDFLSGCASSLLRDADEPSMLAEAEQCFQQARRAYTAWYDLARTDQNLAVVDVRRADIATTLGQQDDERRHLISALDRLLPALLAKFAVRFTLMSQKQRQNWNTQQAHGFDVAVDCAMRLHDIEDDDNKVSTARLVADLILVSRIQGVLAAAAPQGSSPLPDELAPEEDRVGPFIDHTVGTGIAPAIADFIGVGDQPSLLVPSPRLIGPDGRVVLTSAFQRALDRYEPHGLLAEWLHRPGSLIRL